MGYGDIRKARHVVARVRGSHLVAPTTTSTESDTTAIRAPTEALSFYPLEIHKVHIYRTRGAKRQYGPRRQRVHQVHGSRSCTPVISRKGYGMETRRTGHKCQRCPPSRQRDIHRCVFYMSREKSPPTTCSEALAVGSGSRYPRGSRNSNWEMRLSKSRAYQTWSAYTSYEQVPFQPVPLRRIKLR